jgi:TIR domain
VSEAALEIVVASLAFAAGVLICAAAVSRERLISLFRLDRMIRANAIVTVFCAILGTLWLSSFVYHIPTMPVWPIMKGWRFKGFVCSSDALAIVDIGRKCPFLGIGDLAIANYQAAVLWAPWSISFVTIVGSLFICCTGADGAFLLGLLLARLKKRRRKDRLRNALLLGSDSKLIGTGAGTIFISYRRADTRQEATLLSAALSKNGAFDVFLDVERLPIGMEFPTELQTALMRTEIFVVMIGPDWIAATESDGRRRLDDRDDYVRVELRTALQLDIPVVPFLVRGACMPKENDLPQDIAGLARRQAFVVHAGDGRLEVERFLKALQGQQLGFE